MHWITDARTFSTEQADILRSITAKPVYVNKSLYQGIVETKYQTDSRVPAELQRKIDKISFDPLDLVLETSEIPSFQVEQGLKSVIKTLVWEFLKLEVQEITRMIIKEADGYLISYTPYIKTVDDIQPVYLLEAHSGVFRQACRLAKFVGFEVYTSDNLGGYVLSTFDELETDQLKLIGNNLIVGPVESHELKQDLEAELSSYRSDFHFYITVNNCELNYTWLSPEFAKMWSIQEIHTGNRGQVYRSYFDPGYDLEAWFRECCLQIWQDRLPAILVPAADLADDFEERNSTNQLITTVKAIRAYAQMVSGNPALARAIFGVKATDNGLLRVPVTDLDDRKTFIGSYAAQSRTSLIWNVKIVKSKLEGVLTRYLMQKQGIDSFLLELNGTEHVIYTVPGPTGPDITSYSSDNYEAALKELRIDVLAVHKHCANIDDYRDQDLMDLLTLIEVIDGPDSEVYCFPASELSALNIPVNPITRVPLSEHIMSKIEHINYGIRGYFDLGILHGVYTQYPKRQLLTVTDGVIKTKILEPGYISVSLVKDSGIPEHLFDIMLPESQAETLELALNNLWKSGYLMSDWGQSLYSKFGQISVKPIRDWFVLQQAADSKLDGIMAMIFIQRAEHELS